MILDSSAVVAILLKEPSFETLLVKLASTEAAGIGTPTLAETAIVLAARLRFDPSMLLTQFLLEAGIVEVPFGDRHWREAVDAYLRFGRTRHPASLNFGDCLTYAVAKLSQRPLLCVGEDFSGTDLPLA